MPASLLPPVPRISRWEWAVAWLLVGLTGYVLSFAAFLLKP